jgi:hypothetical protein
LRAQQVDAPATIPATPLAIDPKAGPPEAAQTPEDKRILGVLPNYRTTEASWTFQPLTAGQKFHIAMKDSFDWPGYLVGGGFAALYQMENANPTFGQGVKGYALRYTTAYADQVIGNMMTEAIIPSLLHEDPRYFRLGTGSGWHRFAYSSTRIFVTHTDSGGQRFNTSEVLGNGITAAIGNAYYPGSRSFFDTTQRLYMQLATDAFSNVLKEFWPDMKRKWFNKHSDDPSASAQSSGL